MRKVVKWISESASITGTLTRGVCMILLFSLIMIVGGTILFAVGYGCYLIWGVLKYILLIGFLLFFLLYTGMVFQKHND